VPAIEIGMPTPAEVATAVWIGLPCRVSAIIASEPPLIPISDEPSPIRNPYPSIAGRPGNSSLIRQRSPPNSSRAAIKPKTSTKASLKITAGATAAIAEPTATPTTIGTVHTRITPGITAPRS